MTTATLKAMQDGKAAANARRARQHGIDQAAYLSWVKDESMAYRRLTIARDVSGSDSTEAHDAERLWQATIRAMPKTPPDHAWS